MRVVENVVRDFIHDETLLHASQQKIVVNLGCG